MTAPPPTDGVDPAEVGRFAFRVWSYKQGEMVSLMIHLGDRLRLYAALDGAGPMTAEDLAAHTGLHVRWPRDMTRPDAAAAAIRRALVDDGTWLVKEIRCDDTWAGNRRNPMLAMFLGFSLTSCMSSALSEPDGAGLGTIGLPPQVFARLAHDAGFTRVCVHDFDDPANLYYEVRP